MSKRQEFREKQRRSEQRVRWIWESGVIVIVAVLVAFFVI